MEWAWVIMIDNYYNRYINNGYEINSNADLVCKTEDFIFLKEHKINLQHQRMLSWSSIERVKKFQTTAKLFDKLNEDANT